jgi:hypothetical protein
MWHNSCNCNTDQVRSHVRTHLHCSCTHTYGCASQGGQSATGQTQIPKHPPKKGAAGSDNATPWSKSKGGASALSKLAPVRGGSQPKSMAPGMQFYSTHVKLQHTILRSRQAGPTSQGRLPPRPC